MHAVIRHLMVWRAACPVCKSTSIARYPRRGFAYLVSFLLLPFRCNECDEHFFKLRKLARHWVRVV